MSVHLCDGSQIHFDHDIQEMLREKIAEYGSQKAFCQKHDIIQSQLSAVLSGKRLPDVKTVNALGLYRVVTYWREDLRRKPSP